MVKLYSKCQWVKSWYRECILIKYMPLFIIGVNKLIGNDFSINIKNKYLIEFINYLNKHNEKENKLVFNFSGKIDFSNKILNNGYEVFSNRYKNKCHCT
jgi:hypothetical protein